MVKKVSFGLSNVIFLKQCFTESHSGESISEDFKQYPFRNIVLTLAHWIFSHFWICTRSSKSVAASVNLELQESNVCSTSSLMAQRSQVNRDIWEGEGGVIEPTKIGHPQLPQDVLSLLSSLIRPACDTPQFLCDAIAQISEGQKLKPEGRFPPKGCHDESGCP